MIRNKSLIGFLMVCLVVMSSFLISFDSKAAVFEEYVDYAEPATSDSEGYLSVLLKQDGTGVNKVLTFFWYCVGVKGGVQSPVYMYLNIQPNKLEFAPGGVGSIDSAYYCLSYWDEYNQLHLIKYSSSERFTLNYNGYTVYSFIYKGNVGQVNVGINNQSMAVFFNDDGQVRKLSQIYSAIMSSNSINEAQLSKLIEIVNTNKNINNTLGSIMSYLQSINSLEQNSNGILQNIYNDLQEFLSQSGTDKSVTDKFASDSKSQSQSINDLNQQSQSEKVDIDSASGSVDSYIDTNAISSYSGVLASFTGNPHILQFILIVLAVGLVSYVLFGKR